MEKCQQIFWRLHFSAQNTSRFHLHFQAAPNDKLIHLYRLTGEGCMDLLLKEQKEYVTNPQTLLATDATGTDSTMEAGKILDIPSSLELGEAMICSAAKKMLLNPGLLHALNVSKTPLCSKKKSANSKRSFLPGSFAIILEVLSFFRGILKKLINFHWFQNETDLIQTHIDIAAGLLSEIYEERRKSCKKGKGKKISESGDSAIGEELVPCCCDILHLLCKSLDLASLSQCLSRLLKLLPLSLTARKDQSEKLQALTPNTTDPLRSSELSELLVHMLEYWTDQMAAKLTPDGMEVLLSHHSNNSSSQTVASSHKTSKEEEERDTDREKPFSLGDILSMTPLKLKVVPSFEEACGLVPDQFKPFFEEIFCVVSEPLTNCAVKMLTKLPQLLCVCAQCIPESALSSPKKLEANVHQDIAVLLIKSEEAIFERVNSWLQGWRKKPPKDIIWWLVRAFLEAKNSHSSKSFYITLLIILTSS